MKLLAFIFEQPSYLVALKDFDDSCSLGIINGQLCQKLNDVM